MNEFKGTPGPWTLDGVEIRAVSQHESECLCTMQPGFAYQDALMLAAAPTLFEALTHMVLCHYPDANGQIGAQEECWASIQNAQAAIAKALGEPK